MSSVMATANTQAEKASTRAVSLAMRKAADGNPQYSLGNRSTACRGHSVRRQISNLQGAHGGFYVVGANDVRAIHRRNDLGRQCRPRTLIYWGIFAVLRNRPPDK